MAAIADDDLCALLLACVGDDRRRRIADLDIDVCLDFRARQIGFRLVYRECLLSRVVLIDQRLRHRAAARHGRLSIKQPQSSARMQLRDSELERAQRIVRTIDRDEDVIGSGHGCSLSGL